MRDGLSSISVTRLGHDSPSRARRSDGRAQMLRRRSASPRAGGVDHVGLHPARLVDAVWFARRVAGRTHRSASIPTAVWMSSDPSLDGPCTDTIADVVERCPPGAAPTRASRRHASTLHHGAATSESSPTSTWPDRKWPDRARAVLRSARKSPDSSLDGPGPTRCRRRRALPSRGCTDSGITTTVDAAPRRRRSRIPPARGLIGSGRIETEPC